MSALERRLEEVEEGLRHLSNRARHRLDVVAQARTVLADPSETDRAKERLLEIYLGWLNGELVDVEGAPFDRDALATALDAARAASITEGTRR